MQPRYTENPESPCRFQTSPRPKAAMSRPTKPILLCFLSGENVTVVAHYIQKFSYIYIDDVKSAMRVNWWSVC